MTHQDTAHQDMNNVARRSALLLDGLRSWRALAAGTPRLLLGLAAGVTATGCSDAHNDLFDSTRAALAGELGGACGEVLPVVAGEVDVDDKSEECGAGVCMRSEAVASGNDESAGLCTCRCDGPAGTGPFCACADGFSCQHQIDDLDLSDRYVAGSYCVPND